MTKERKEFLERMEAKRPKFTAEQRDLGVKFLPGAEARFDREHYGPNFKRNNSPMSPDMAAWRDEDEPKSRSHECAHPIDYMIK